MAPFFYRLLLFGCLVPFTVSNGTPTMEQHILHVSPAGDDAAVGDRIHPIRTLACAAARAQPGDTVVLHAGTYRETLAPLRSGTAGHPIIFEAAPGEQPVISAADPITGWVPWKGKILAAPMGWSLGGGFDQVFARGTMQPQARWPNQGGADPLHPVLAPMRAFDGHVRCPSSNHRDHFWKGGTVVGRFHEGWTWQHAQIKDSTADGEIEVAAKSAPWFTGIPSASEGKRADAGAGYLTGTLEALDEAGEWHHQDGKLYLWPTVEETASSLEIEAKRRQWCVDFGGHSFITIRRISLFGGAVHLDGSNNLLTECTAKYAGHFTFFPWSGYKGDGGADEGHQGIFVSGDDNRIQHCRVTWTAGSGLVVSGKRNLVTRCHISQTDYSGTYGCAIKVTGADNRILRNTAWNSGRDILQLGRSKNTLVYGNDFSCSGMLCKDLGIIYLVSSEGKGTRISYNWIHDNLSIGPRPGIYLDNYCRDFTVDHNVIWGCPKDDGIRVNGPSEGNLIFHNTLIGGDGLGKHSYNCWPNNRPGKWPENVYKVTYKNNLWIKENPKSQLMDPTNRDFRLKPDAKSIGQADATVPGAPPNSLGKDNGAYQFGQPSWTPGADGVMPDNLP